MSSCITPSMKPLHFWLLVFIAISAQGGCTLVIEKPSTAPPARLRTPRTLSLSASSAIGKRPMGDDADLLKNLERAARRSFPRARVVQGDADLHVIVVLVDYEPGCAPHCGKFPTYRNWSCTVLSKAPFAQAFGLEGASYNPFVSPARDCMSRLAAFLKSFRAADQHSGSVSRSGPKQ